jgi:hypothetical protein
MFDFSCNAELKRRISIQNKVYRNTPDNELSGTKTMLSNAKKAFIGSTLAMGLTFGGLAHADNNQCAPLEKTSYGMELGASYSAHAYSEKNVGSVGISIFPGADLEASGFTADQLGTKLVSVLRGAGINAECFVNNSHFDASGTALGFKVGGLSIQIDGDDSFNMAQVQSDKRILKATVAEAKTAKQLLASTDPDTLALNR